MGLPAEVLICEVGPRDGFQYEDKLIPLDLKVEIIRALVDAGVRRLQIASFVHPQRVPQMVDAEEVVRRLLPAQSDIIYAGLALNGRGVERAAKCGLSHIDLSIATHEEHARDNANMSLDEAVQEAERMVQMASEADMHVQMGLQTVFGFRRPGDVPLPHLERFCRKFAEWGIDEISLGDTTGLANPAMIRRYVHEVQGWVGDLPIVLHLHDTRGLGLANVLAAVEEGITRFDTSFGGMGGCPFVRGAAGNVPTEDTVYLLESLGVRTGIDVERVSAVSRRMEIFLHHRLPGKMHGLLQASAQG